MLFSQGNATCCGLGSLFSLGHKTLTLQLSPFSPASLISPSLLDYSEEPNIPDSFPLKSPSSTHHPCWLLTYFSLPFHSKTLYEQLLGLFPFRKRVARQVLAIFTNDFQIAQSDGLSSFCHSIAVDIIDIGNSFFLVLWT